MNNLRDFGTGLSQMNPGKTFHYRRPANLDGATVWQEDGQDNAFETDNGISEFQIHGVVDHWTKTEYDKTVDNINGFLFTRPKTSAMLSAIDYEDETGRIHFHWDFWLT